MCYKNNRQKHDVSCENTNYNENYLLQLYAILFYANGL